MGTKFCLLIFCLILLWDLSLTPGLLQLRHLRKKVLLLSCQALSLLMQLFTCRGLWFCSCRGISSQSGDIFLLPHRTLVVSKLGFSRCAVAFLQGLTVITRLHFSTASFVISVTWPIGWAMPQPRGSARFSQTISSLQLFTDGKQIGVYSQRSPLMLATRNRVVHLNRTFRDRHCERWR